MFYKWCTIDHPQASSAQKHSMSVVLSMRKPPIWGSRVQACWLFSWELVCLASSQLTLSYLAQAVTRTCVNSKRGRQGALHGNWSKSLNSQATEEKTREVKNMRRPWNSNYIRWENLPWFFKGVFKKMNFKKVYFEETYWHVSDWTDTSGDSLTTLPDWITKWRITRLEDSLTHRHCYAGHLSQFILHTFVLGVQGQ